ncbi:MAG TPA: hypothetical protein PK264_23260, partial [Hyphomicrobiaceae bacterium]|nr:hypothetical protein [Hyphomicrobiaceae bacterium]
MRCNPLRWLWGLIPVAMLSWLALLGEHERIESDLGARVREALTRAGLGQWATASFKGRDGRISGSALEDSEPAKATEIARGIWGVRIVDDKSSLVEKVDRFEFKAVRADNRVRLTGFAPSPKARAEIAARSAWIAAMAKAAFPNTTVDDQLVIKRGAPADWLGGVSFGLRQLSELASGEVSLEGTALTVTGLARTPGTLRAVRSALKGSLPRGISLKDERIRAPQVVPYTWQAAYDGKKVVMSGHVPSEAVRADLLDAVKKAIPAAVVEDGQLEYADGAPADWPKVAILALRELGRLESGTASLSGTDISFTGLAGPQAVADNVRQALQALPKGYKLAEKVTYRVATPRPKSPYVSVASVDNGSLLLSGYVPSAAAKSAVGDHAKAQFPSLRIINELEIADGAPGGWLRCMEAGVTGLKRVGNGRVRMTDRLLEVDG